MQYRLAYAQATRRQAYVESRWAAQPAQLVELALKRAIRTGEAGLAAPAGCGSSWTSSPRFSTARR
jgi:cholesterol transport system auxiliary component